MEHVIRFRRPGLHHVLTKLCVPTKEDPASYVRRLENLGYKIVDIIPPLERPGPPQNPHPRTPGEVGEAESSLP